MYATSWCVLCAFTLLLSVGVGGTGDPVLYNGTVRVAILLPLVLEDGLKAIPVPGTSYNLLQVIQNWTKVTVPFADDINGIPLAIENAFGEFEDAFGAFATMASRMNSTLDSMQVANAQTVALVDDIHIILQGGTGKQPGTPWLTILRTLLITLGVFVAIWYITSAYDDLRHGWRMMTGQA